MDTQQQSPTHLKWRESLKDRWQKTWIYAEDRWRSEPIKGFNPVTQGCDDLAQDIFNALLGRPKTLAEIFYHVRTSGISRAHNPPYYSPVGSAPTVEEIDPCGNGMVIPHMGVAGLLSGLYQLGHIELRIAVNPSSEIDLGAFRDILERAISSQPRPSLGQRLWSVIRTEEPTEAEMLLKKLRTAGFLTGLVVKISDKSPPRGDKIPRTQLYEGLTVPNFRSV